MRQLENKYSKSERLVARARFSYLSLFCDVLLASALGGALAAVWIFAEKIETFFTKADAVRYLTEQNLKWALLAIGALVLIAAILRLIIIYKKELIVTESKIVSKSGVLAVKTFILPIEEIKTVESDQNVFQRIFRYGNIVIITDAEKPYKIKHVVQPEKLAQKIVRQTTLLSKKNSLHNMNLTLAPARRR